MANRAERAAIARANGRKGGRPKGRKNEATLTKEAARARVCQRVYADIDELLDAQLANAKGISHFFLRNDKTKQFVLIDDPKKIQIALNMGQGGEEGSYYWIHTKDPSIQAFTDLMNRALDKPKEQEQDINFRGNVDVVDILKQRQARNRERQR